ncbi:MAG: hypothetical protein LBF61_12560 [Azoarcus sp.]|jgi:hypothetical protein|nr:hypothetical protein [Azoarcus sp.]
MTSDNIVPFPANKKILDKSVPLFHKGSGNSGGPPTMELHERVSKIEAKMDAAFPTFATKEDIANLRGDFHKEFVGIYKEINAQTWKFIGFSAVVASALVSAVYYISRHLP